MDKEELRKRIDLVELIESSGVALHKAGAEWTGRCPFHDDSRASLSVSPEKGLWKCFGCARGGDCFSWVMERQKVDFRTAVSYLQTHGGTGTETVYDIEGTDGRIAAQHVRRDYAGGGKGFIWRRDGRDSLGGIKVEDLPLYGLKVLRQAAPGCDVIIVEGEKAADALNALPGPGRVALATVTGAHSCPSADSLAPVIGSRRVYLWPDNDDAGRRHMEKVAGRLQAIGIQPCPVHWHEAPPKGDAFDFVSQGGDLEALLQASADKPSAGAVARPPAAAVTGPPAADGPTAVEDVNNVCVGVSRTLLPPSPNKRYKSVTDLCCNAPVTKVAVPETAARQVADWVQGTGGRWWDTLELDADLGFRSPQQKNYRRLILYRLRQQGLIEGHPRVNRKWRYVDHTIRRLNFKGAAAAPVLDLRWPLGIERYVNLYPGNIAVVAGAPNAGKTALLLNFIRHNQERHPIYYWCSEMGEAELEGRLKKFEGIGIDEWKFEALERAEDFEDVIVPDCVNVVDYLEMTDELYRVNEHLTAISRRIGSGLAVVALQKKEGVRLGRGQEFGLEKPKLYLSMDRGRLSIVKGKSWADPDIDPNGLSVLFRITGGCRFEITTGWQ